MVEKNLIWKDPKKIMLKQQREPKKIMNIRNINVSKYYKCFNN
jgi:hypothetical protein